VADTDWSASDTMWPGPRPTSIALGVLIHPTVGRNTPTSQTDRTGQGRQTDNGPIAYTSMVNRLTNGRPKSFHLILGHQDCQQWIGVKLTRVCIEYRHSVLCSKFVSKLLRFRDIAGFVSQIRLLHNAHILLLFHGHPKFEDVLLE